MHCCDRYALFWFLLTKIFDGEQVMGLQQRGIRAEYMGSAQIDRTVNVRAENGEFDVLYMTPEKACSVSQRSVTSIHLTYLLCGLCR
jgi:hypothetical protein